ncbi:serine hydrolase domain-containing protein [Nonomuraea sp. NPDC059023]|uniref:serine hydrolase domain-containing protein n=1 Tax=unclassified Nonomuraea TaxID=2593643 RepID=UPI0036A98A74
MTATALTLPSGIAHAGTGERRLDTHRAAVQQKLDALVKLGNASAQILVVKDGRTLRARAGTAELGKHRPVPYQGRFRIASVTKTFTASVILQLAGERKVDLDTPVERYLPGVLSDGEAITVRMLLNHTSGLANPFGLEDVEGEGALRNRDKHFELTDWVAKGDALPRLFKPGSDSQYSNTNYYALGLLIQAVTGQDWGQAVTERIIRPLRLRHTWAPGDQTHLPKPHVRGYTPVNGKPVDITRLNPTVAGPAGALVSTTADLDRFITALLSGKIVKPAQLKQMLRPNHHDRAYGLGIYRTTTSCGKVIWGHNGGIPGYGTDMMATLDGKHRAVLSVAIGNVSFGSAKLGELQQAAMDAAFCG